MNLLMLSGDVDLARGRQGPFSALLERFAPFWSRIDILCPPVKGGRARQVLANTYVHPSPWPLALHPLYILRQGRCLLAERDYGLVVSHDYGLFYNGLGAWLLTAGSTLPVVSEIHHVEGHPFALTRRELFYRWWAKRYLRWARGWVAAFRAVNQQEIPVFLAEQGIPESKIHVLPSLYLDFATFRPLPDIPKSYDVLFVGRLAANKGLFTLLEALARVHQTRPDLRACLLGEGPLATALQEQAATLGLTEALTFLGRLADSSALARLYNSARVLVCASTSEGGPRVTLEAMACGTPVISTPVGVMKDLLAENGRAFLVFHWGAAELAQKIQLVLGDEALCQQLAHNGQIAARRFRADELVPRYAQAYLDLAHQSAKSP
jgi:glycosyltransferase involved in cell wall biosynthesis